MTMTENPPSSFPSTFSRAPSTAALSSSTSKAKSKRWSLNIVSPQPTSAPRPLHLSAGPVVGSSPNSSHSPSPGDSQLPSAGSSKGGGVGIDSPSSSSPAPSPSSSMTNLRRPLSSTGTGRRQSSISYIASSSDSPSRPNFSSKRDSVDSLGLVRSPLSSSHHTTSFSNLEGGGGGLERSNSLDGRRSKPPRSPAAGERSSTGTLVEAKAQEAKDRPPVTLAEKHSELLHFIAQKESKCLELRSQLTVHEAELLQLKRKWERIVNRGFERTLSPSNSNSASATSPTTTTTLQTTTSASSSPSSAFHPYSFSSNVSLSTATAGVAPGGGGVDGMLEGIKGGVQGMSRLLAAGLGSIAQVVPAEQAQAHPQSSSAPPLPLMLGGTSTRGSGGSKRMSLMMMNDGSKGINGSGHGQKESQSSTSTTSSAASSSLLSASSGTSATSASASISGSSTSGNTTKRTPSSSELETESEFGDFEDGLSMHSHSYSHTQHEQVLMVHDTGATPTMSPNPAFKRRQKPEDTDNQAQNLDFQQHCGDGGEKEDFDWDDGWEESPGEAPASERNVTMSLGSASVIATQSKSAAAGTTTTTTTPRIVGAHAGPKSPLAPMSAIPTGLASIAGAAPTAQQMSSWVGSVGKRWDEITGSTTFTQNQKRASLLFSDMQQSLVSALASPSTASGTSGPASASASSTAPYYSVPPTTASGNVSSAPSSSSSKTHSAFQLQPRTQRGMSTSLLDDSDDESFGESGADAGGDNTVRLAPVMVPDSKGATRAIQEKEKAKAKVDDEDEWNW